MKCFYKLFNFYVIRSEGKIIHKRENAKFKQNKYNVSVGFDVNGVKISSDPV